MKRPEFCFVFKGTTICFIQVYPDCWICSLPGFVGHKLAIAVAKASDINLDQIDLSTRVRNALKAEGLRTVYDVIQNTEMDLSKLPNFGIKAMQELRVALRDIGYELES